MFITVLNEVGNQSAPCDDASAPLRKRHFIRIGRALRELQIHIKTAMKAYFLGKFLKGWATVDRQIDPLKCFDSKP
jgi:hypothetical protein